MLSDREEKREKTITERSKCLTSADVSDSSELPMLQSFYRVYYWSDP